jgi:deoxyribonuclease-1
VKILITLMILCSSVASLAGGNESIESFSKAKKVYHDHQETIYCGAEFDIKKNVIPPHCKA